MRRTILAAVLALWPVASPAQLVGPVGPEWKPIATADFNGDGKADILWRRDSDGAFAIWYMDGANVIEAKPFGGPGAEFELRGVADFNKDGKADLLFRRDDGLLSFLLMSFGKVPPPPPPPPSPDNSQPRSWFWSFGVPCSGNPNGYPVSFSFNGCEPHMLLTGVGGLNGSQTVKLKWQCPGCSVSPVQGSEAKVSLIIVRQGNNWTGTGAQINYRQYHAGQSIVNGGSMEVPLQSQHWSNVFGQQDAAGFADAVANAQAIGLAFGDPGAGATAHGVKGSGTFTYEFRID